MTQDEFCENIKHTFDSCLELVRKKNLDYSGKEDALRCFSYSKLVGVDPNRAILVRISDKLSRISNLLNRKAEVYSEQLEDTITDAINYLAILKASIEGGNQ